jgi:hypothetical protein
VANSARSISRGRTWLGLRSVLHLRCIRRRLHQNLHVVQGKSDARALVHAPKVLHVQLFRKRAQCRLRHLCALTPIHHPVRDGHTSMGQLCARQAYKSEASSRLRQTSHFRCILPFESEGLEAHPFSALASFLLRCAEEARQPLPFVDLAATWQSTSCPVKSRRRRSAARVTVRGCKPHPCLETSASRAALGLAPLTSRDNDKRRTLLRTQWMVADRGEVSGGGGEG